MALNTRERRRQLAEESPDTALTSFSDSNVDDSCHDIELQSKKFTSKRSLTRIVLLSLAPLLFSVAIILVGAEYERIYYIDPSQNTSTLELYTQDDRVCAGHEKEGFITFENSQKVPQNVPIAHCGPCGECSNMQDMAIYAGTTQTLTDGATKCSTKGYIQSLFLWRGIDTYKKVASECLTETVGFTRSCETCWINDMACSIQQCVFTCLKSVYLLREPKNDVNGNMNACLECDEKICGPEFLKCSGSNRRRQGIHSDIRRGGAEICKSVTMDWTTSYG